MNQTIEQKNASGKLTKTQMLAHRSKAHRSKGKGICDSCLSPPLLCSEKGEGGFLGYIKNKYGYERMDSIDSIDYELMRTALSEIISTGSISQKTTQAISKKIKKN